MSTRKSLVLPLALVVVLTALVRLCVIEMWPRDLDISFQHDGRPTSEEVLRGVAARDLLQGPLLPLAEQRTNEFSGGSIVATLAAVPAFALLGPSLGALRVSTLFFSCAAAALCFLLLDRSIGRRAAWLGGLLLALPPPSLVAMSCMSYGTHAESIAFAFAALLAWSEAARHGGWKREIVTGIALGFGLFFTAGFLLVIVVVLTLDLARDAGAFARPPFLARVLGFAAGYSPEFLHRAGSNAEGLALYGRSLDEHFGFTRIGSKAVDLVTNDLAVSYLLPFPLGWLALVLVAAALAQVARTRWKALKQPLVRRAVLAQPDLGLVALLYTAFFCVAYVASGFAIEHGGRSAIGVRYFAPFHAFTMLAVAIAGAELGRSREQGGSAVATAFARPSRGASLACAALAALFAYGTAVRLQPQNFGRAWSIDGFNDSLFARVVARKYAGDDERIGEFLARLLARRPPEVVDDMLFSMALSYRWFLAPGREMHPRERAKREAYDLSRRYLFTHAPEPQRYYFVPVGPNEPLWRPGDQRDFLAQFGAR